MAVPTSGSVELLVRGTVVTMGPAGTVTDGAVAVDDTDVVAVGAFGELRRRWPAAEVLGEARWLASQGVTEIVLVSENSTSYGKDRGDLRSLEKLLPQLAAVEGVSRVRVAYLQPAELRPGLLEVIAETDGVAPYYDLSFQHSSPTLLRRMRRFGGTDDFLTLIERARSLAPTAGFRTNVILGFPGETEDDVAELERFLTAGRLDAVGVEYRRESGPLPWQKRPGIPGRPASREERALAIAELVANIAN